MSFKREIIILPEMAKIINEAMPDITSAVLLASQKSGSQTQKNSTSDKENLSCLYLQEPKENLCVDKIETPQSLKQDKIIVYIKYIQQIHQ